MPNGNLTTGQIVPGFFGFVDYNAQGGGQAPTRRALLWAYISAVAQRTPNQPFLPASQQEANDGAGRGSDLARMYAAAVSQPEAQGADIWLMPITAPSGGVASTYTLKVYGTPTKAGTVQLWIASQAIPAVGFTTSDTALTILTAIRDAILTVLDLPIASAIVTGTTLTITYLHKGTTGEDFPVRCNVAPSASGINVSPAQALFATAAVGAGSVKVTVGGISVSTILAGGETAAGVATKVAASFNADSYPLTAVVDGTTPEQVNFFFANDKDVRRLTASIITTTGTTVNLGSGATDGSGSTVSLTYNGTVGVGNPSLTAALTNIAALDSFRSWAVPWLDNTTISALATSIENSSDGSITGQKQQHLTITAVGSASAAGAIATSASPNLTTTAPHYAIQWALDASVQGYELSARTAAARAAIWLDTPQKNWNGFQLKGSAVAPILAPNAKPSLDAQNTALRTYNLAPVIFGASGTMEIVKGRTTSAAADKRLWAWSTEAQAAFHFVDLGLFFESRFKGGNILRYSEPKAPGIFDKNSFESATRERMRKWETDGNYDGADALAPAVKASPDGNNPFRMNVEFPESPVLDLDQVVFTGHFTQPST